MIHPSRAIGTSRRQKTRPTSCGGGGAEHKSRTCPPLPRPLFALLSQYSVAAVPALLRPAGQGAAPSAACACCLPTTGWGLGGAGSIVLVVGLFPSSLTRRALRARPCADGRAPELPVHFGVGERGPPRQAVRPGACAGGARGEACKRPVVPRPHTAHTWPDHRNNNRHVVVPCAALSCLAADFRCRPGRLPGAGPRVKGAVGARSHPPAGLPAPPPFCCLAGPGPN